MVPGRVAPCAARGKSAEEAKQQSPQALPQHPLGGPVGGPVCVDRMLSWFTAHNRGAHQL